MTKAHHSLNLLHWNLSGCSRKTKQEAYTTLVRPVHEYIGMIWDPYQANHISQLETVQCKAARFAIAHYSRYSSVTRMMDTLGWRTLQEKRFVSRMSLFYRAAHKLLALYHPTLRRPNLEPGPATTFNKSLPKHTQLLPSMCSNMEHPIVNHCHSGLFGHIQGSSQYLLQSRKYVYGSPKRHPAATAARQYRLHCCPRAHLLVSKSNWNVH